MERRKELATFLKNRRTRITPDEAGIATTTRRRTPGLRREEVAQRAAVGITWYTWLEQGRNITVSPQVLHGIARALQFNTIEQRHLFALARLPIPEQIEELSYEITPKIQAIINGFGDLPVMLINQKWDVLAWNPLMQKLCGTLEGKTQGKRNILRIMFTDPQSRNRILNWEQQAKSSIGLFRSAKAKFVETEWYLELIANLTADSKEFREWWPRQTICQAMNTPKRYSHPDPRIGKLDVETTLLDVPEYPNLQLLINTPVNEQSRKKLTSLNL